MPIKIDDVPSYDRPVIWREVRAEANFRATVLDAQGSEKLEDIVAQIRARARRAVVGSRLVLFFLLLTVIAGLFFYLALPYIKQYLDGRRLTLRETENALVASSKALDAEQAEIRADLIEALQDTNEVLTGDWPQSVTFRGIEPAGDGALLVRSTEGTLLVYPRPLSIAAAKSDLSSDAKLRDYIAGLPDRVFALPTIVTLRDRLADIIGQRRPIDEQLSQVRSDIEGLWTGLFPLNQQRESFAAFMATCRGLDDIEGPDLPADGFATDPDAVTLACTQAWQADLAARTGNWWQTLAEQVPPGILLLFLLATLGGLYRYNLRLAGFHASRADLLELVILKKVSLKASAKSDEPYPFVQLADALAADKVEFGKASNPTDQAVEMARAIMSRTK